MLSFFIHLCIDITVGPMIDAMISGTAFGISSNMLNDGKLLWNMDKL